VNIDNALRGCSDLTSCVGIFKGNHTEYLDNF